ncbi:E3 ubiquitin-protein ligase RNF34a isoform X2 [Ictalurus punctatus]|uniref:E3 ubiquitin-protein ligase RNF34a isoform X2 n=1 Tax=Ictalurus punctatus TaxID=7998 RepID=A0A9F7RIT1_ICTPU|nr:E3 ubiquitin-protein ligase RNF34a isoform X2 [Ictalurus punctatus]
MKAGASCVWASCCDLLNEVMGAGAVRGQQPGFGGAGPFRFAPSAGYSTHTTTNTHPHTHTHTNTHTHANSNPNTNRQTRIHPHTHTHTHPSTYSHTHTNRQTRTHTHTHPNTHSHTHTHTHTHPHPHTPPQSHTLSCQGCRESFSIFRRRYVCCECRRSFCSACSVLQENLRTCSTCNLLKGTAFQRPRLMKLRVKDLQRYLTLHNINTDTCREKEDLVNLVLFHQGVESEDDSDTPTFPTSPLHTPPTTNSASLLSPAHEEPISRDDGSESTSELVDSESLSTLEPTEQTPEAVRRAGRASLSDLSCVGDVERLTVRQLKEILAHNFVNFSGCCEKWELVERVRRLYTEKSMENVSRDISTVVAFPPDAVREGGSARLEADENLCRICMDAVIDCVLLECGHMVTCTKCGKRMSECPICRQYVIRAVHVFKS